MLEEEEPHSSQREELQAGCLELSGGEEVGTELPATIQALRTHIEHEEERLRLVGSSNLTIRASVSCGFSLQRLGPVGRVGLLVCRTNGRTHRLVAGKDQK